MLAILAAMAAAPVAQVSPFAVGDEAAFFSLLDLGRTDLAPVKAAVARHDWAAAKQAWAEHLQTRLQPRWTWSHRDRATLLRLCQEKFGGMNKHIREADRVLARDFDILGVRKQLEHHVEWLQGPIEWTHVLSRFAYWRDLGLAYWATGKKAYADDFVLLARDWIADNPVPSKPSTARGARGSVWRTLEAGIRGDSWFEAMELFMDAPDRANGYDVPGLLDRHEKMFEFLMNLRQPDGTFVSVGDAGFGRRNSVADSLGLGALMYQRPDFRFLGPNKCAESWLWLFGPGVFDQYARLKPQAPTFTPRLLPDAKYAVMRTGWDADAGFLFFDCAPWRGGHSHRDSLQVVVSAGRELLIDPGNYSYDQPLSVHYFRKTEAHNVLMV
jgi:hypothetical protein